MPSRRSPSSTASAESREYPAVVARERVRRQPRGRTRQELLDAAARVFAARGFHGASVEAISEEAGYSTGALYSNFASKEELFLSLYEERMTRRARELREAFRSGATRAAGLTAAALTVDDSLRADRDFFLLYFEFALHAARNREFAARFRELRAEGFEELVTAFARGLDEAGLSETVSGSVLARAARALGYGLALDRLVDGDPGPPELVARILQLTLAGARAEAERTSRQPPRS